MPARDDPALQFGGEKFERASRALCQLRRDGSLAKRLGVAVRNPGGAWALATLLAQLPRVRVATTDSDAGRALRSYFRGSRRGIPWNRVAHGVLALPPSTAEYLSGRSRQALRTNLHRAKERGMECARIPAQHRRDVVGRWLAARFPEHDPQAWLSEWIDAPPPEADWWMAADGGDAPLAIAAVSFDAEWVLLHTLASRDHLARWLLHTCLVTEAIEAGARYVCVDAENALQSDSGVQYFQRLLGYRVVNLRLAAPRAPDRPVP